MTPNNYPTWVTPPTDTHCTAPGCIEKQTRQQIALAAAPHPRPVVEGTELCLTHHSQFPLVLGDMVTLMRELELKAFTKGKFGDTNDPVQTSGHTDVGALWNPAVSHVLAEITDWAQFLARTIIKDYHLPEDYIHVDEHGTSTTTYRITLREDDDPRAILAAIARWYSRWISGYPGLGAAALDDANTHRRTALRALQVSPVRRVGIRNAFCLEHLEDSPVGQLYCMAPLVATLRPEDEGRPSEILCSANPSHVQIPRQRWMEYSGS